MKKQLKICISLLLFNLICNGLYSQNNKFIPYISFGGVTSQVEGDGYSGFNKPGFELGTGVAYHLSELMDISFEIRYMQRGSRKVPRLDLGDTDYFLMRLHFVDVPVMMTFKLNKLTPLAGVYWGYLMGRYMEDELGTITAQMQGFKDWEAGVFIGLGYQIHEKWNISLRSGSSVTPFRDYTKLGTNFYWYNRIFNRGWYNLFLTTTVQFRLFK
ncbi:MAG: hypothetical protein KatS3mg034_1462 [Vicingaceae bacterium]|nr:MAG: hypothetical protein KatS3mg034_1462 [Vicingaceae bacterium]